MARGRGRRIEVMKEGRKVEGSNEVGTKEGRRVEGKKYRMNGRTNDIKNETMGRGADPRRARFRERGTDRGKEQSRRSRRNRRKGGIRRQRNKRNQVKNRNASR
jgi:hypothetical protein